MKIDILCGSGSPDGVSLHDLHGTDGRVGVGGAEYALLTLCEAWSKEHQVVVYNNARRQNDFFEQRRVNTFDKDEDRDVFIVFREPTSKIIGAKGLKIFFSCDQYTTGDFRHFSQFVDKTVTISPFHSKYFAQRYEIRSPIHIDLPVRTWEYDKEVEKIPFRLIFTSVPDRGLEIVRRTFPAIRDALPETSLVITSDYRLWGVGQARNESFVASFNGEKNVQYLGAVTRDRLIQEQLKAQIHYYPFSGETEELFCIAAAESQVAGVLPITSSKGALETTNMGVLIDGDVRDPAVQRAFVQKTIDYLTNPTLPEIQKNLQGRALERFDINVITKQWQEKVFQ